MPKQTPITEQGKSHQIKPSREGTKKATTDRDIKGQCTESFGNSMYRGGSGKVGGSKKVLAPNGR